MTHESTGYCPNVNLFERSLKRFFLINLGEVKESDSNCLSPKGEFWNRLERALDLLKNVSEPAKNDFHLGNSPSSDYPKRLIIDVFFRTVPSAHPE
jgi:hypothetical protein